MTCEGWFVPAAQRSVSRLVTSTPKTARLLVDVTTIAGRVEGIIDNVGWSESAETP